jgi:hypothetical protein
VPSAQLQPENILQWRWRCVRVRRPNDSGSDGQSIFRNFAAFRSWVGRQVAMLLAGLLLHVQAHDDHAWQPPATVELDRNTGPGGAVGSEDMADALVSDDAQAVHPVARQRRKQAVW